jgi:hypothetical protein
VHGGLGEPDERVLAEVEAIRDLGRLDVLLDRLLDVAT